MAIRFQFSLRTLLVMGIAIAALIGFFILNAENARLRLENSLLRAETGFLEVYNPDKAWARIVPLDGGLKWRVRIYVPQGGQYRLGWQTVEIVPGAINRDTAEYRTIQLAAKSELLITAQLSPEVGGWGVLKLQIKNNAGTDSVIDSRISWRKNGFDQAQYYFIEVPDMAHFDSTAFDTKKPLVLTAFKVFKSVPATLAAPATVIATDEPGPGLLLWFEEVPQKR